MTKEEKEQIAEFLVWAYKEGFKEAIRTLQNTDKALNEEQLQAKLRDKLRLPKE